MDYAPSDYEAIARLERAISEYAEAKHFPIRGVLSLTKIREALADHPARGRAVSAAEDLLLNIVFLHLDMVDAWGSTSGVRAEASDLHRIDCVRASISFVLRYRAVWDKIMGFLILLLVPSEYDNFLRSTSRKKHFLKVLTPALQLQPETLREFTGFIQKFDDQYRTAEAHGPGRLRKHIFDKAPIEKDMRMGLTTYWNGVTLWLHLISGIFDPELARKQVDKELVLHMEPVWTAIRERIAKG